MALSSTALSRAGISAAIRFEGHAIVSADGRIADAAGGMPAALRNPADWQRFQAALDLSALVVLGRLGHRRHANPGRRRLVFTGAVSAIATDPDDPLATLFNPAGATLAAALLASGTAEGVVAITGGTRVFDAFLPLYDAFDLAEVNGLVMPAGIPGFSTGHPRAVLAAAGLVPTTFKMIDAAAGVSLTHWSRPG